MYYRPRIVIPRYGFGHEPEKRRVIIHLFYSPRCPHCEALMREDSPFNRALARVRNDPSIELVYREIDVDTEEGMFEADEAGVEYTPTVFINGEQVPNKFLNNEEKLTKILLGQPIPSTLEEIKEKATHITRKIRRGWT